MSFNKFLKWVLAILVVFGIISSLGTASGQSGHYSAASFGMGGTGTAYIDTYHANFVNPANLLLESKVKPSTTVGFIGGVSAVVGGPLVNVSLYNDHFTTGEVVNTKEVLDKWFEGGPMSMKRLGMELDVVSLAGSWRGENMGFSLALRNRSLFTGSVNKGYVSLLLSGISQEQFMKPTPINFSSKGVVFSEISAGFSYKIFELQELADIGKNVKIYAGVAPKFIFPHHTISLDFNSTLHVASDEIVHDFQYKFKTSGVLANQFEEYYEANQTQNFRGSISDFVEPNAGSFTRVQGTGFGIDLGGTIEMDLAGSLAAFFSWANGPKKLRIGASITDLGSVKYQNGADSFSADKTFYWDGVDFEEGFSEALSDSISSQIYLDYQPGDKEKIVEKLPSKINFGSHLQLGKLGFAVDFKKGLNKAGMNSLRLAMGFGVEYKLLNIIPLRAGYRTGGLSSAAITLGTGLELQNFEFTIAGLTVPNSSSKGSGVGGAWSGLVFRF